MVVPVLAAAPLVRHVAAVGGRVSPGRAFPGSRPDAVTTERCPCAQPAHLPSSPLDRVPKPRACASRSSAAVSLVRSLLDRGLARRHADRARDRGRSLTLAVVGRGRRGRVRAALRDRPSAARVGLGVDVGARDRRCRRGASARPSRRIVRGTPRARRAAASPARRLSAGRNSRAADRHHLIQPPGKRPGTIRRAAPSDRPGASESRQPGLMPAQPLRAAPQQLERGQQQRPRSRRGWSRRRGSSARSARGGR